MLGKKEADQIIAKRFGDRLGPLGFKWMGAKAGCFVRKREGGADMFAIGHVNYTTVQKISGTIGVRFERAEDIRDEALSQKKLPAVVTFSAQLGYFAGRLLEWECGSPEELDDAIDEIFKTYLPKALEYYDRYRDPLAMLAKLDDTHGDQRFAFGDEMHLAIGALIIYWLWKRDGFEARLAASHRRFANWDADVVAPLDTVVTWLRAHPELRGQS